MSKLRLDFTTLGCLRNGKVWKVEVVNDAALRHAEQVGNRPFGVVLVSDAEESFEESFVSPPLQWSHGWRVTSGGRGSAFAIGGGVRLVGGHLAEWMDSGFEFLKTSIN